MAGNVGAGFGIRIEAWSSFVCRIGRTVFIEHQSAADLVTDPAIEAVVSGRLGCGSTMCAGRSARGIAIVADISFNQSSGFWQCLCGRVLNLA